MKVSNFHFVFSSRKRVFQNRVLRRIFWPKRDKVTGEQRKLHNEKLNDLYSSSNIVWVIKSRSIRWARHVVCMGERGGIYRVLMEKPERKMPLGRIILRCIFWKWDVEVRTAASWLTRGTGADTCECGNGPLRSIKCVEFLD